MTTFVQAGIPGGVLYLPPEYLSPPPTPEGPWRDQELLKLTDLQLGFAGPDTAVDALGAARRVRAQADAMEYRALARLDALRGRSRNVPDEAALELRCSPDQAADRIARATVLTRCMPRVLAAMDAGELEGYPAGKIADACARLTREQAGEVDDRLAAKIARGQVGFGDPVKLLRAVRRLVAKVDPDGQTERARVARCERKVQLIPGEETMSRLIGELPAEVAASAYGRIDAMARRLRNTGDARNLDQLRADVYADLLLGNDPGVDAPAAAAVVFLHLPITTALTMTDHGCELDGYGPLPGPVARDILTNPKSVWRKVLTDPATGAPLDVGRTRRRPTQAIRDFVAVRDRECPFCHRPAHRCDFDHREEWVADHGVTSGHNGDPKCEHHHYLKDMQGWKLDHDPATRIATITSPTGRTYPIHPNPSITEPPEPEPEPPKVKEPLGDDPPF